MQKWVRPLSRWTNTEMSTPLRLALFYAALYLGIGVSTPYAGVWFRARGLSGGEIGVILAAPQLARVLTGPALAIWADRFRLRRTGLALVCLGAAAAYGALLLGRGYLAWLALWFTASSLLAAAPPLIDTLALRSSAREGFDYGRVRALGSAAFIVGDVAGGALIQGHGSAIVMPWASLAAALAALVAAVAAPPEAVTTSEAVETAPWLGMAALLRAPRFVLAIGAGGLIQSTHAFYYGFSTLVWRAQGLSSGLIGVLWGLGVGAEVAFLFLLGPLRRRLGAERLLILGGVAAVVRWTAFAFRPPVVWLVGLQMLHAGTFAATFLASLELAQRFSPPERATSAQMLNSVLSGGVLIGLATLASGALFDRFGAGGYLAMSGMAAVGLVGAVRLYRLSPTARPAPVG